MNQGSSPRNVDETQKSLVKGREGPWPAPDKESKKKRKEDELALEGVAGSIDDRRKRNFAGGNIKALLGEESGGKSENGR